MTDKQPQKRSKYNEHFERNKAPQEKVAKVIMSSSTKKKDDWKYMKKLEDADNA